MDPPPQHDVARRLDALQREASILGGMQASVPHAVAILETEIARVRAELSRLAEARDHAVVAAGAGSAASLSYAHRHVCATSHVPARADAAGAAFSSNTLPTPAPTSPVGGNSLTVAATALAMATPVVTLPQSHSGSVGAGGVGVRKRIKLKVPAERYPEYNFVGRLLGPRGATLKKLERDTGCKIMIRGRGSIRKDKEADVRGKPGWEHVFQENLHVVIEVADAPDEQAAHRSLNRAKEAVELLLVPVPEEKDSLKRQQLRDLAILNGTFRSSEAAGLGPTPSAGSAFGPSISPLNGSLHGYSGVKGIGGGAVGSGIDQGVFDALPGYAGSSSVGCTVSLGIPGSRNVGMSAQGMARIPTLDIESMSESFLVSNVGNTHGIPAPSPTIVDPEMYPFPSTPGLIGSHQDMGTSTTYGSPIWSPMRVAPQAPPPLPQTLHQNQHQLGPPFAMSAGSHQQNTSAYRSPPSNVPGGLHSQQPPNPGRRLQGASFPPFRLSSPFSGADLSDSAMHNGEEKRVGSHAVVMSGSMPDLSEDTQLVHQLEQHEQRNMYMQDHQLQLLNFDKRQEKSQEQLDEPGYQHPPQNHRPDPQSQQVEHHHRLQPHHELYRQEHQQHQGEGRQQLPQSRFLYGEHSQGYRYNSASEPGVEWQREQHLRQERQHSHQFLAYQQQQHFEEIEQQHGTYAPAPSRTQGVSTAADVGDVEFQLRQTQLHAYPDDNRSDSVALVGTGAPETYDNTGSTKEARVSDGHVADGGSGGGPSDAHSLAHLFPSLTTTGVTTPGSTNSATGCTREDARAR
jgi:hypothetical protein